MPLSTRRPWANAGGGAFLKGFLGPGPGADDDDAPEAGGPDDVFAFAAASCSSRKSSNDVGGSASRSSSGTGLAAAISATAVASCSSQKVRAVAGEGPGSTTPVGAGVIPGVKSRRSSVGTDEEEGSPAPTVGATSTKGCSSASLSAPTRRSRSSRDKARIAVARASWEVSPTKDEKITSSAV